MSLATQGQVTMVKNIVVFSDGTGQAGGLRPEQRLSNVYKLYRAARIGPDSKISPSNQVGYYDPGLGSGEHEPFWSSPRKAIKKLLANALGTGISTNVADCYEFILKHYEPGDRIYLFGFSRGAYTVRCVTNVMNVCGVPTHGADGGQLPRYGSKLRSIAEEAVHKVYEHGASKNRKKYEDEREEQARRFREKYGSEGIGADGEPQGNVQPYFVGVFDTVAALGTSAKRKISVYAVAALVLAAASYGLTWLAQRLIDFDFWQAFTKLFLATVLITIAIVIKNRFRYIFGFPKEYSFRFHFTSWGLANYDRFLDNLVPYARHAISIDESRASFPPVPWGKQVDMDRNKDQVPAWLRQVWFAGNHSDIGGSYPEDESRLSDIALDWMIEQIQEVPEPVILNMDLLNRYPDPKAMQHCEIESTREMWPRWWPSFLRLTWSRKEREASGGSLHPSVVLRFECENICDAGRMRTYLPEALRNNKKVERFYISQPVQSAPTDHTAIVSVDDATRPKT